MAVGKALYLFLYLSAITTTVLFEQCDAGSPKRVIRPVQKQQRRPPSRPVHSLRSERQTLQLLGSLKRMKEKEKLLVQKPVTKKQHLVIYSSSDPNYVGSPFTMPPYEDVMGSPPPFSSPQPGDPIYCVYPPPSVPGQPPSTGLPAPMVYPPTTPSFPPAPPQPPSEPVYFPPPIIVPPNPPESTPMSSPPPPEEVSNPPPSYVPIGGPPGGYLPSPQVVLPSPPSSYVPSPTAGFQRSPPPPPPSFSIPINPPPSYAVPSPPPPPAGYYVPSPPDYAFEPPVVFPPPLGPPAAAGGTAGGMWCVAKPSVPDPIIQEAMDYACGSGADCEAIQPHGSCYQPDTLINHASYAFNSFWQRTRAAGGLCDFGGTAIIVTKDPSVDGCHFLTIVPQATGGGE